MEVLTKFKPIKFPSNINKKKKEAGATKKKVDEKNHKESNNIEKNEGDKNLSENGAGHKHNGVAAQMVELKNEWKAIILRFGFSVSQ